MRNWGKVVAKELLIIISTFCLLSLFNFQPAHASGPECNPSLEAGPTNAQKKYVFTGTGTCTWTVPAGLGSIQNLVMIGGGGGGGAGSFNGASAIGGGGGGGAMGSTNLYGATGWSLTAGTTVTVTLGSGGVGGSATSKNAAGGNGSQGGTTSWVPVSGTSISVTGGAGGTGGSYSSGPVAGAGGNFTGMYVQNSGPNGGAKGGSGYLGNGGGGAGPYQAGGSGTTNRSGVGGGGGVGGLAYTSGGSGGTSGLSTNTTGGSDGGSSSRAASNAGVPGAGGGGGAGCRSETACANINGANGQSGSIQLVFSFGINSYDSSNSFDVGQSVNKMIARATPTPGSATWFWNGGTIPQGLSINTVNTSDGVALFLQGVPTAGQSSTSATFAIREPLGGKLFSFNTNITINKSSQSNFALANLSMFSGQNSTLSATGAQGSGTTTYSSNSSSCVLSGVNNAIVTATSGTGTCTITASNSGDSGFNPASASATITLSTVRPSLLLTSYSPNGVVGQQDTLTASLSNGATGQVVFRANGSTINSCGSSGSVTVVNSVATCVWTPASSAGSPYSLTANYLGDGSFSSGSTSISGYQVYNVLNISASNTSIDFGQGETIAVTSSGGAGSTSDWTWTIAQASDSSQVTGISIAAGIVSVSSTLPVGTYSMAITAVDTATQSASSNVIVTINRAAPTPSLSIQATAGNTVPGITVGRQVNLVMNPNITGVSFANRATFYANGSVISGCAGVFISAGNWSCWFSAANTSVPNFNFYAISTGDSNINSETTTTTSNFNVSSAISLSYSDISMATGDYAYSPPTISGGTGGASTWSWGISQYISGSTITGVSIDHIGNVRVESNASAGTYVMNVTAGDVTGATASAVMTIIISNTATPIFNLSRSSETQTVGTNISGYTIANSGPVIAYFGISPALPSGLSFDPSSGLLTGSVSNAQVSTTYTITAYNSAGNSTASYSLTISAGSGGGVTITISLSGGGNTAIYNSRTNVIAQTSQEGKVTFYLGSVKLAGCISKLTSSQSATCSWKPSIHGGGALTAILSSPSNSFSSVKSAPLQVSISRRTDKR